MSCVTCDHEQSDCISCAVQMGTGKITNHKILISIYDDLQIVLKSIRIKDYIAAEEVATDISGRLAMLAAEERKG